MKVIFLGTRGFPNVQGGVEKHCENLAVNLVQSGCQVTVFTRRPYVNKEIKEYKGVRLIDLPAVRQKSLEALLHTFLGIIKCLGHKPDIVHIHGIGPGLFIPLAKLLGFKVVLTTHGSNYMHQKWNKAEKCFLKVCESISMRFADQIIAVSDPITKEVKERYGRDAYYIPNGVQLLEYESSGGVLDKYNLEKGKYILAVGRIVPEKGFHVLIEAFQELKATGWKLVIAGGADHESKYSIELFDNIKKDERIIYTGFLSGKPLYEIYDNAGIYVLPSSYEGMPISLMEAMSFGLYCIASDIAANRSLGLPEENYFKVGDSGDLAAKLNQVIGGNFNLRLTREQIDSLLCDYDWGIIAQKTLEVYNA